MKIFYILTLSFCILNSANAQYNATNGIYGEQVPGAISLNKITDMDTATSVCSNPNTFWGIETGSLQIKEFDLTNNIITYTGSYIPNTMGYPLAICNNLNGGAISPTIYMGINFSSCYWNGGANWMQNTPDTLNLTNAGGYGNYLYYFDNVRVYRYNGASYSTIYTSPKTAGCADLAVDSAGNAYLLTKPAGNFSDSIVVISPGGQIINQYSLVINSYNAYGCFLLNGILYIGLGTSNSVYPNTILPVSFSGSNAIIGIPIPLPAGVTLTLDLASCNPGNPLDVNSIISEPNFTLFPNPANENITITMTTVPNTTYAIYDVTGKNVIPASAVTAITTTINVNNLKKGVYFVEIGNEKGVVRKKFAKM